MSQFNTCLRTNLIRRDLQIPWYPFTQKSQKTRDLFSSLHRGDNITSLFVKLSIFLASRNRRWKKIWLFVIAFRCYNRYYDQRAHLEVKVSTKASWQNIDGDKISMKKTKNGCYFVHYTETLLRCWGEAILVRVGYKSLGEIFVKYFLETVQESIVH